MSECTKRRRSQIDALWIDPVGEAGEHWQPRHIACKQYPPSHPAWVLLSDMSAMIRGRALARVQNPSKLRIRAAQKAVMNQKS